jgi:dihydroxyacetone kinase-like protein
MSTTLTRDDILDVLQTMADDLIAKKDELTKLDADLGDGDLGRTVERGFKALKAAIDEGGLPDDIGRTLFQLGKTFSNEAPSSFGSLYGTALMKGGMALKDKTEATLSDIADATQNALDALMERGGADLGDKTMLDAIHPAIEAMRDTLQEEGDEVAKSTFFRSAADAAHRGAEETKDMQSQIGRASWQGERSSGKIDPGARAIALMLESVAAFYE